MYSSYLVDVLSGKKIYSQELNTNNILNDKEKITKFYENDPMHEMFIGEVIDIIDKR